MKLIVEFLSALILSSVQVFAWYKISDNKINFKKIFNYFAIILLTIISLINFHDINMFIKTVILLVTSIIVCKILLKQSLREIIIVIFVDYILIILVDTIFGLSVLLFFNKTFNTLFKSYSGSFIADIVTSTIIVFIIYTNIPKKVYKFLNKISKYIIAKQLLVFVIIVLCGSEFIFALTYFQDIKLLMIINIIIVVIYSFIIIMIIQVKNKYISVNKKYTTNLENLHAQELIIKDYRMMNHENNNNLMTIKGMTTNRKVNSYIDSLIKHRNKFQNKILNDVIKLPEGGIRGLIYSKMVLMKEKGIDCQFIIDKKITIKQLSNISDNDTFDVCQILGVVIDNAIDSVANLEQKEILISIYKEDNNILFKISNNHNQTFDNNENLKTTKGNGHGYGLKLVKKIVNENNNLNLETVISKDVFAQIIKIKS